MKLNNCVKTAAIGVVLVTSSQALAKECSEIEWKQAVLNEYPQIAEACQGIFEMNGREYVELDAKYVRSAGDQVRLQFLHQDGSYGETYQTKNLPKHFKIDLDGKERSIHQLTRDSTLQLFIPTDRFTIVSSKNDMPYEMPEEEVAYTALPKTASNTSVYGLLGALALVFAMGIRVISRKNRV